MRNSQLLPQMPILRMPLIENAALVELTLQVFDLNAADGRLYYTVEQPGSYAAESPRYSVGHPAGERWQERRNFADSEILVRSAKGVQLRDNYGVLTLTSLPGRHQR